ncbi:MAG: bifunctional 2-C-methyl-D-erythritol 4-phosphate cytidylyltransferase/2-C-methyl-D-erythritol 2,4-cyclodiphosphate synthase [Proteobacteria bacterium]|nr:bifunctional 2-C-methyl-D-erythritol 4-phosphate cytidylyltransferase/2-C-methyl-D-erythritol 2,4-cyclodiphosphate synthase [Pseudomonadota bacterium]
MPRTIAIIVGAGRGHRFGGGVPKQYLDLCGRPVLGHTLRAFAEHRRVDAILPVIHPDDAELFRTAALGIETLAPVFGGAQRQDSVLNGLRAIAGMAPDYVLVHDAARPRVAADLIDRVLDALANADGAVPALPVTDTLKRTDAAGRIADTVSRDGLWRAQTPQGFRFRSLLDAHEAVAGRALTDDAAVAEAWGLMVGVVPGSEENIKITTAEDMARMTETIAGARQGMTFRIGNGYDVHRLGPGSGIHLGGILIPFDGALIGHSDADVALHAITDAVLGAIADGDIGSHFPPSDPRWRGAASEVFLRHAAELVEKQGGGIENIDLTVISEAPKIGPYRHDMRVKIAEIVGLELSRVSVKATTTEQLGFTGRGEGIAAQASVLIRFG